MLRQRNWGLLVGGPELKHPFGASLLRTPPVSVTYMDGLKVTLNPMGFCTDVAIRRVIAVRLFRTVHMRL